MNCFGCGSLKNATFLSLVTQIKLEATYEFSHILICGRAINQVLV